MFDKSVKLKDFLLDNQEIGSLEDSLREKGVDLEAEESKFFVKSNLDYPKPMKEPSVHEISPQKPTGKSDIFNNSSKKSPKKSIKKQATKKIKEKKKSSTVLKSHTTPNTKITPAHAKKPMNYIENLKIEEEKVASKHKAPPPSRPNNKKLILSALSASLGVSDGVCEDIQQTIFLNSNE